MSDFPEAPISVTFKIKSPNGFEHMVTLRKGVTPEDFTGLMTMIAEKEAVLLAKRFTPLTQGFPKREKPPVEYVEGRVCPKDGAKIVRGTGKIAERCENYKYDYSTKRNVGTCEYILWN